MSESVTLRKLTEGLWKHEPNDRDFFFTGKYRAIISETKFVVYSDTGRLACSCPISGVNVVDGGDTFSTSNYTSLAVDLFDRKYPGIYIYLGQGGGSSNAEFKVYERTVALNSVTVESGLSDIVVVNRNAPQDAVTFTYSTNVISFTSGVVDGDNVLIFAKKAL